MRNWSGFRIAGRPGRERDREIVGGRCTVLPWTVCRDVIPAVRPREGGGGKGLRVCLEGGGLELVAKRLTNEHSVPILASSLQRL